MTAPKDARTEADELLEQLLELSRDVTADPGVRAQRLALLRRLEGVLAEQPELRLVAA